MSKDEIVPNVLPETGYVRIAQIIGDKKKKKNLASYYPNVKICLVGRMCFW